MTGAPSGIACGGIPGICATGNPLGTGGAAGSGEGAVIAGAVEGEVGAGDATATGATPKDVPSGLPSSSAVNNNRPAAAPSLVVETTAGFTG